MTFSSTTRPMPRWGATLSEYPGTSNQLILVGGQTTVGITSGGLTSYNGVLNDYYSLTYSGGIFSWLYLGGGKIPMGTGITPRYDAAACFDGKTILVVGGSSNASTSSLCDTWSFTPSATWVQQPLVNSISASGTYAQPTNITAASMSYNPIAPTGPILYGGGVAYRNVGYSNEQWGYVQGVPGTYTLMSNPNGASPPARQYAAQATDTSGNTLLFGGQNANGPLYDCWLYTTAAGWKQITATTTPTPFVPGTSSPSARYGAAMAYDQTHSVFVLFGGLTPNGYDNTTWTYTVSTQTWTQQTGGTAPTSMAFASMAYLTSASGVVLFGGLDYQQCYNGTYLFGTTSWTKQ